MGGYPHLAQYSGDFNPWEVDGQGHRNWFVAYCDPARGIAVDFQFARHAWVPGPWIRASCYGTVG